MEFGLLGPLAVSRDGRDLLPTRAKQRALLAVLLLDANDVVSSDRLLEALWGERPPAKALNALHGHVSALRKGLGAERIETRAPGYLLLVEPGELDAERFEQLLAASRAATEPAKRSALAAEALALFRGEPMSDFRYEPFAQAEIGRLEELRLVALEERIEAELALGRQFALVPELERLVAANPLRERLRGLLMLTLYRCDRQGEALEAYAQGRQILAGELGLEPGASLKELERRILAGDKGLVVAQSTPSGDEQDGWLQAQEDRRVVTAVFCDLADSTALGERLDPERLRRVLQEYFRIASEVLTRHGGTVEKFIGDAVVAVFGVPRVREDDALRAVRAAVELRDALAELNESLELKSGVTIAARIGVNTGEVVAGAELGASNFVTGDAVNIAARLEQAAAPGDVIIGEQTLRLVRDAVDVEPLALEIRGKSRVVGAARVKQLDHEAPGIRRRLDAPLIGRELELEQLRNALAQARRESAAHLFTLVGAAGVGKSRLTTEFVGALSDATVAIGRCIPYGDETGVRTLREILHAIAGEDLSTLEDVLGESEHGARIATAVRAAAGLGEAGAPEERLWALRRLLEAAARRRALVIVVEDLHWAAESLLDLLEDLASTLRGSPVLLLCTGRPEFLDTRPTWGGGKLNAAAALLEPLTAEESERLIDALEADTDERRRRHVIEVSEGNPFFVEQLLAFLRDGEGDETVPPTIQALLSARLDALPPFERAAVERAAVLGIEFSAFDVGDLLGAPQPGRAEDALERLVLKEIFRRSGDVYVFRHALIRNAAYARLPKQTRAELHERAALRLQRNRAEDELIGYHLERAFLAAQELGPVDDHGRGLAREAAEHLGRSGHAAIGRANAPAAVNLLSRALALAGTDDRLRGNLLPSLCRAFAEVGRMENAAEIVDEVVRLAAALDEREGLQMILRTILDPPWSVAKRADPPALIERGLRVFGAARDDAGLALTWRLASDQSWMSDRWAECADAAERALAYSSRAGGVPEVEAMVRYLPKTMVYGPIPVADALRRCEEMVTTIEDDLVAWAAALRSMSVLLAMGGRFDEAREQYTRAQAVHEELGLTVRHAAGAQSGGRIELLAGDPAAAEAELRGGYDILAAIGENDYRSTVAGYLAEALYEQERYDETAEFADICRNLAQPDDMNSQTHWPGPLAKVMARRGEIAEAESLLRRALDLCAATDNIDRHGNVLMDLAEVLTLSGRLDDAENAVGSALAFYDQKANAVSAARARKRLAELQERLSVG